MGSFSRRSQQRESGLQARRARVVRKREKLQAWKPRIESLEHELMPRERMKECETGQASPFEEEGDLEEVWRDCMEVEEEDDEENWTKRDNIQKELREVGRLSFVSKEM